MIIIIILAIFFLGIINVLFLLKYIKKLEQNYIILYAKYEDLVDTYNIKNDIFNYLSKEVKHCYKQLKIYEKEELERNYILIKGIKYKKNNIFRGKRVLLGEDFEEFFYIIRKNLQKFGMIVEFVSNNKEVYKKVIYSKSFTYDLIILNNEKKGLEISNKLKKRFGFHIPILLCSKNCYKNYLKDNIYYIYLEEFINDENMLLLFNKIFNK